MGDWLEHLPATAPTAPYQRIRNPVTPINGNSQFASGPPAPANFSRKLEFELPTRTIKPVGTIRLFDLSILHTDPAITLQHVVITRTENLPGSLATLYERAFNIALPFTLEFNIPLVFPFGQDNITPFIATLSTVFSGAGGAGTETVLYLNWLFTESLDY